MGQNSWEPSQSCTHLYTAPQCQGHLPALLSSGFKCASRDWDVLWHRMVTRTLGFVPLHAPNTGSCNLKGLPPFLKPVFSCY